MRRGAFVCALLCAAGCALSAEDAPVDPGAGEQQTAAAAAASIALPVIRSFRIEPIAIDGPDVVQLTFRFELAPWWGAPLVCKIDNGVGGVTSPATRRLHIAQTTTFTLSCRPSNTNSSSALAATRRTSVVVVPPLSDPEPAAKAVIFYYPWYGTPAHDQGWFHWDYPGVVPPVDITSPYYPQLGAYSVSDPLVLAQHMAWLRQARVGVIALSWWGRDSFEEAAAQAVLDMAQHYRIKAAFHIEPYHQRSARTLVDDVAYLYERYGGHPAFHRTLGTSRYSPKEASRGVFFLWSPQVDYHGGMEVDAEYWRDALDAIHGAGDGALVMAHGEQPSWIDGGHFDGLYNYGTLDPAPSFTWAVGLPPGAWYVPSVLPGSTHFLNPSPTPHLPREDGATFDRQWRAALGTGVQPELVTITSFNEWHEGTQIEPVASGVVNSAGQPYLDYTGLAADGYLRVTREQVGSFLTHSWPQTYRARIRVITTSDWTVLRIDAGAGWIRPERLQASSAAITATMEDGNLVLIQPFERAEAGLGVEMTFELLLHGFAHGGQVRFAIERGHLGATTVMFFNAQGTTPVPVATVHWSEIAPDPRNTLLFELPAAIFTQAH